MNMSFAIRLRLKLAAVEEGVKALEKEFRTIERRMHSWILFPSLERLSARDFMGRFWRSIWPTNMGRRTFLDRDLRVFKTLTLAMPRLLMLESEEK